MARRSSSGSEVLLGLLTIEPMSGYDLGQTIRVSIGHFWNESYGQIYPNLKRLAAEGLVTAKAERQKGKPDRHIYSITPKGRERLAQWLAVAPQPEVPRNELLLKLFFGSRLSTVFALLGPSSQCTPHATPSHAAQNGTAMLMSMARDFDVVHRPPDSVKRLPPRRCTPAQQ